MTISTFVVAVYSLNRVWLFASSQTVVCQVPLWDFPSKNTVQFSSVQLLSGVWLFATPWTAACQASLSLTNSQTLLKLMSIESVMPSNHLILCHPLLLPSVFPRMRVFSNESTSAGQNIGASASASVLPMIIQDWFPLWLTGLISLLPKGLSRVFSNTQFKSITTVLKEYCSGLPFPSPGTLSNTRIEPASPVLAGRF